MVISEDIQRYRVYLAVTSSSYTLGIFTKLRDHTSTALNIKFQGSGLTDSFAKNT